jgi:hypothetical protein
MAAAARRARRVRRWQAGVLLVAAGWRELASLQLTAAAVPLPQRRALARRWQRVAWLLPARRWLAPLRRVALPPRVRC